MTTIREMTIDDYENIFALFKSTPGITTREADSRKALERYLLRNPSLNFIAKVDSEIAGCVMCGHDGRRGYLQHLVVSPHYRRRKIGERLVGKCIEALKKIGIDKTHIFIFKNNSLGNTFWQKSGWQLREDIHMYSFNSSDNENA